MSDYTLTPAKLRALKSKLTRAKKKGPDATLAACDEAFQTFEAKGYPDCWSEWQRARDDAVILKRLG